MDGPAGEPRENPRPPARGHLGSLDPANLVARALRNSLDGSDHYSAAVAPPNAHRRYTRIVVLALVAAAVLLVAAACLWCYRVWKPEQRPYGAALNATQSPRITPLTPSQAQNNKVKLAQPHAKEALDRLQADAAAGDAEAQFQLGVRYRDGDGVPQDRGYAVGWWRQAAEQGHLLADVEVAKLYSCGQCAHWPVSWSRTSEYYRQKAEEGDAEFMRLVAACYRNGRGIEYSPEKALYWYTKSYEATGHGAYNVGEMHYGHRGMPRDDAKAFYWVERAAQEGYYYAQVDLAEMYLEGRGTMRDPKAAAYWAHRAAEGAGSVGGDGLSQTLLARMYYEGLGVEKDNANAVALCHLAIELGNGEAAELLNRILGRTSKTKRRRPETFERLLRAAEAGETSAQYQIGRWFFMGQGTYRDGKKGLYWTEKAAQGGHALAAAQMAEISAAGIHVPRDFAQADAWREKSEEWLRGRPAVPILDKTRPEYYDTH